MVFIDYSEEDPDFDGTDLRWLEFQGKLGNIQEEVQLIKDNYVYCNVQTTLMRFFLQRCLLDFLIGVCGLGGSAGVNGRPGAFETPKCSGSALAPATMLIAFLISMLHYHS